MRSFDLSPLLRSTVGFDNLSRLVDAVSRGESDLSYPPYNIEKTGEDQYRIVMAVAGFASNNLDVTVTDNSLVISGRQDEEKDGVSYLHRGIAQRAFERRFQLAETIRVTGAALDNGLLTVTLTRQVPEHMKPRQIKVVNGKSEQISSQAA